MARPEQRICGITAGYGSHMRASCDASTFPHVVGSVRAGIWSLIVFMTLSEEQSVGAWLVGTLGSLTANGENGLLLHVIH
jgi:hypothetical protein